MGNPGSPGDVMLFSSVLFHDASMAAHAMLELGQSFGGSAYESEPVPFTFTSYYHEEMGAPLQRIMVAFTKLIPRNSLPDVKNRTNIIEESLRINGRRTVNLDPGILSLENICLATTKPYSHRIYLDKGIWTEITLMFRKDSYESLAWTYPDYASRELIDIFNKLRSIYKERSRCQGA